MRGLMTAALLILATVVAAEDPDTIPIGWGTWYDGQGNRADTGLADTDGDDWLTVVADGRAVMEIRLPRATTDANTALADRVLQLERQVADLTRRLDEAKEDQANLYGRGITPPSNTLELQPQPDVSYFDGCNWTHCNEYGACASTLLACPQTVRP